MPYYDVSIPLRLKTLTYFYEQDLDLVGYAVRVPLRSGRYSGLVIEKREQKPEGVQELRKIEEIIGKVYESKFLDFIKWLSFYYVSELGVILRATFFEEIVEILRGKLAKQRKPVKLATSELSFEISEVKLKDETLERVEKAIENSGYKTLLIHSPNPLYEFRLLLETVALTLSKNKRGIFIVPTIAEAKALFGQISDHRAALLHSELRKSELIETLRRIISGEVNIVVGTRIALFAPLKGVSVIFVSQESSWLYKAEESPRYNLREASVMRGFIETAPVILCDFMPSISSYYNAMRGKFEFIDNFEASKHPEIRILKQPKDRALSQELVFRIKTLDDRRFLILSPQTGYSLLRCDECAQFIKCPLCSSNLIFHRESKNLECRCCKRLSTSPEQCPYCGSFNFECFGTGVERVLEEVKGIASVPIEYYDYNFAHGDQLRGVVISKLGRVTKSLSPIFDAVVFLDFDFLLSIPDYRAPENAFSKLLSTTHLVNPEGTVFIQTRNPENQFYRFLRNYDFKRFYQKELILRKETLLPPFGRIVKLQVVLGKSFSMEKLERVKEILNSETSAKVAGPFRGKSEREFYFLLRSTEKRRLIEETHSSLKQLCKIKGINCKVEVDPTSLGNI